MRTLLLFLLLLLPLDGQAQQHRGSLGLSVVEVIDNLEQPTALVAVPSSPEQLCLVQSTGEALILDHGRLKDDYLLDISGIIKAKQNHGLMSLAFHPDFATNGRFYAYFLDVNGDPAVAQFQASPSSTPNEDSIVVTIKFAQPFPNTNRGWIGFGPERLLYVSTGDGGDAKSAPLAPQNLLGKLLRIAPSDAGGYQAPFDNPLRRVPGALPEIWAMGFHSPGAFFFDTLTGRLFLIDSSEKEGSRVVAVEGPKNSSAEVKSWFSPVTPTHLIGGGVYRGSLFPELQGGLILGEPATGKVVSVATDATPPQRQELFSIPKGTLSALGTDGAGNLYAATDGGVLYKASRP